MRFLLGLICGAAATLFAAAALNGSPAAIAEAVAQLVDDTTATAIEQWSPADAETGPPPAAPPEAAVVAAPVPLPKPDAEPVPAAIETVDATLLAEAAVETGNLDAEPPGEVDPLPDPIPAVVDTVEAPTLPAAAPEPGELVVWSPFYSEASARGFAGRLVRELDVPLEVRKAGPSQYLVTASYRDEQERAAIETLVAGMTGGTP